MIDHSTKKLALLIAALGLWLFASPMTFGYLGSIMCVNDHLVGVFLILLGLYTAKSGGRKGVVGIILLGLWLQLAPLLFWAPEASSYLNDTLIGMVAMACAFHLPCITRNDPECAEETPPGWSFNPSEWGPRVVTVSLALICWFLGRYLAAYQLGYIHEVKDPFFGDGTLKVITSSVSKLFPVSDAGLGAFGYSLEFLLGFLGSSRRWRTMPWLSVFFGLLVVPAGIISILLVVSQPIFVGAWCGICLLIASCMLIMVLLTAPEIVAALQLLWNAKKQGRNTWHVFWNGLDRKELEAQASPVRRGRFSRYGFSFLWNLIASLLLGVWLTCSPTILGATKSVSDSVYLAGPLLVAFSIISLSESIRFLRFVNCALGLFLITAPFWMDGFTSATALNSWLSGSLAVLLSLRKGSIRERYGKWE